MVHSKGRNNPQRSGGGGGGAQRPEKGEPKALPPAPPFSVLRPGRKTPPPRRAPQRRPPPLRQRTSAGHTAVGRGNRKVGAATRGGRRRGAKRPERARSVPKAPSALFCLAGRGRPCGPPPASQTPPPPRDATFPTNAKKATKKPGPTIYGAWPMKPCQEGARQRLHPLGKARAHALWARAA